MEQLAKRGSAIAVFFAVAVIPAAWSPAGAMLRAGGPPGEHDNPLPQRHPPAIGTPTPDPWAPSVVFLAPVHWSTGASLSADGRFVAYSSAPPNRDPGDVDWKVDVFVHDRLTGETTIVPHAPDGAPASGESWLDAISADGRYLTLSSRAGNLVADDTNGRWDVFLHDRETGVTSRVSLSTDGREGNGDSLGGFLSADGRFLVFSSTSTNFVGPDLNGDSDVFLRDLQTGYTDLVSRASDGTPGDHGSDSALLSPDGRYVVFGSTSTNLVGGDTNGVRDVFVWDRLTRETERISVASSGVQANGPSRPVDVSSDGRFVAFLSVASNLAPNDTNDSQDVFVRDRLTDMTIRVNVADGGAEANQGAGMAAMSADGRYIVFETSASNLVEHDTNGAGDVFLHDRLTGKTTRVSVSLDGGQGSGAIYPSISDNGRYIAFLSGDDLTLEGTSRWGVFLIDRLPSEPDAWLATPTVSPQAISPIASNTSTPSPAGPVAPTPAASVTDRPGASGAAGWPAEGLCNGPVVVPLVAAAVLGVRRRRGSSASRPRSRFLSRREKRMTGTVLPG